MLFVFLIFICTNFRVLNMSDSKYKECFDLSFLAEIILNFNVVFN